MPINDTDTNYHLTRLDTRPTACWLLFSTENTVELQRQDGWLLSHNRESLRTVRIGLLSFWYPTKSIKHRQTREYSYWESPVYQPNIHHW